MDKSYIFQTKNKPNMKFGRKVNQGVGGNRKLFWKEIVKVKGHR